MDDALLAPLLTAIAEEDDEAAESAIIELSYRNSVACPPLLTLSQSADSDQRWWAVRGLAALADTDDACRATILPAIVDALSDPDDAVRCVAALALGQLQATSAIPSLMLLLTDPSGWVRGAAADALALMGEAAVPALGEALYDPRDGVRVRAAYALRKICSPKSAGWLFPALNDPNHLVHAYAYETLDQMGLLTTILVR
jgi:HEAT repeat protein